MSFLEPTDDTQELNHRGDAAATEAWRDRVPLCQGRHHADGAVPVTMCRRRCWRQSTGRSGRALTTLDSVNLRFGRNTVVPAAAGLKRTWSTKFERKSSPCFTTQWIELPRVIA